MDTKNYRWILYLIVATIITTVSVQLYWNYKNYEQNKKNLINEIQLSLDNSIEHYFANLSKDNFLTIIASDTNNTARTKLVSHLFKLDSSEKYNRFNLRSVKIRTSSNPQLADINSKFIDSLLDYADTDIRSGANDSIPQQGSRKLSSEMGLQVDATNNAISRVQIFKDSAIADSLTLIKGIRSIFFALKQDSLEYNQIDSLLSSELQRKKILINYRFDHYKNDTLHHTYPTSQSIVSKNRAISKSTYFNKKERFELHYSDPKIETLKRGSTVILLSLLLSLAVISSLFYLLKVIHNQKQLAAIKNDFISNMTHEFKTPIATMSAAVEALEHFNVIDDKVKTKKYLSISDAQLKKLHQMVETLLETATLDSGRLVIEKEQTDLVDLIEKLVDGHRLTTRDKEIYFSTLIKEVFVNLDRFHLENAISNIIDNAIKYGGTIINLNLNITSNSIEISIADNGSGIDRSEQKKIFDKFYRVQKGNIHDVKGFGIGLYYAKKIIEKHGGSISVASTQNNTIFNIILPNE